MSTVSTYLSVIHDIDTHILRCGGPYPTWYCGVAADPRQRLFVDHGVDAQHGPYIFRDCGTDTLARVVEQHFLNKNCKGGPGGGDRNTRFVYAYKITLTTRE